MAKMLDAFNATNNRHKKVDNAISKGYDLIKFVNNECLLFINVRLRRNRVYSISWKR